ncbi:hypothetical protein GCM10009844_01230 [Nocardioides koreensis]|uniref:Peptidase C39-like domain-containing protein n=1 Tax=Nocardioides koreensis TaxID=433651 RepID=A0ABP5KPW1_9ACTN
MELRQPDPTTCGSCCAVRTRMLLDQGYDAWVRADPSGARFRSEALAAHRRTNRAVAAGGALLPWPAALGTQPWALARELAGVSGTRHEVRWVLPWRRDTAYDLVRGVVGAGQPVPVYVGSALLPRHVVLALRADAYADALTVYDPAAGSDVRAARADWLGGRLGLSGWQLPWAVVVPVSPAARRTPA